jgi:ubiquinone biosynthesis monooxygenase Coq7
MSAATTLADGGKSTPGRFLKVNHAGEFGAVNIYRAQILVARFTARVSLPQLRAFLSHERSHLQTFEQELLRRQIPRCKSFWFCAGDAEAYAAIASIVEEEHEHRRHGVEQGKNSLLYKPVSVVVAASTSLVIWLGMVL